MIMEVVTKKMCTHLKNEKMEQTWVFTHPEKYGCTTKKKKKKRGRKQILLRYLSIVHNPAEKEGRTPYIGGKGKGKLQ